MRALDALMQARLQGAKPAIVFVTLGGEQFPWWRDGTTCEIVIDDDEPLSKLDLRPLVGCEVVVIAWDRNARLRAITDRLKSLPTGRLTVLSSTDPDDLGHVWQPGIGWQRLCPRGEG